eukprot:CAMPEP_0168530352 /NCGR_PEP_ID=MMETSP0405-20121227/14604_1 /TAXON_ID=498012 /ORGANISM="Trichosphaerium sp, Strain Am-I-7 wt" /LENGTH=95 /DNA_ID=CAMNT_0008554553 /DNA_START=249 /DNA_END=532 /DNA_ORIENTATION=+
MWENPKTQISAVSSGADTRSKRVSHQLPTMKENNVYAISKVASKTVTHNRRNIILQTLHSNKLVLESTEIVAEIFKNARTPCKYVIQISGMKSQP